MAEGEKEWFKWEIATVQAPCSKSSPAIASMLLKDSIEFPHLYDKGISSRSLVRVKTDTGVKLSVREVKLPGWAPDNPDMQILTMKQNVEIHDNPEERVHTKVVFTVHEDHKDEYKGTIEHSVKTGDSGETLLEYKIVIEGTAALADGQADAIKEKCEKFLTEIATLADRVFFLVGDTAALPPGAGECLEPDNILPHVTHSLLDVAKKFSEIPPWLPIASHGSAPDKPGAPYRFIPEKPAAPAVDAPAEG